MKVNETSFYGLVQPLLSQVEERMRTPPDGNHHPNLEAAIQHLLSSGGKRLRPILVLLTSGMLQVKPEHAVNLAAAIEMLHTATLVHDDLIDGSLLRRGIPTLNAGWTPGATVLTGDYIFARAAHIAATIGSRPLMECFARTLMTIVNGEISQMFNPPGKDGRKDYFDRIYAKTASLFEIATEGSAILGKQDEETVESLKTLGYNLGMAFQIMDDILDFVGNEEEVGKPVANDLRQGIITLPTLCYLETHPNRDGLQAKLQNRSIDQDTFEEVIDAIHASGAIDQALEQAGEFIETGERLLQSAPESPERGGLCELARYILSRTL
jgi:octaprenyl-diphosphate synthase